MPGVKFLVTSYRNSNETPFSCWKHWSMRLQLAARGENVLFWPQNLDIWGQKSIFCLVIAIFVDGTNDHYTRGYNFPIGTTPKKFSVSELGVIFWGSPLFLAVFGHSHVRIGGVHKRSELSWRDSKCPLLQKFHSSDILQKRCLVWLLKINCLWHPSAWPSARLWLARARLSPSLSPWVPPSPSPWTPRSLLLLCLRGRRSPVLQLLDEMPQEEWSSWIGKLKKLQLWKSNAHLVSPTHLCHFLQWKLRGSPLSVIIVVNCSPPMLVWCLTKEFHT